MQTPDDPLAPVGHRFAEPWHAQTLAMAQALIRAGHLSQSDWAQALGRCLAQAEDAGKPDTEETYYLAALEALEQVTPLDRKTLAARKTDWEAAYRRTPHGKPVTLDSVAQET